MLSLWLMLWSAQLLLRFSEASPQPNPVEVLYREEGYQRSQHCSVYCPSLDVLFVIGGIGNSYSEFFSFRTREWSTAVKEDGSPPTVGRSCHLSLLDSSTTECKVVLVEGQEDEPLVARVAKLTEPEKNAFELEWFDNENAEPSGPPGGYLYCGTSFKNVTYILGGYDSELSDRFWQVEVDFNRSSGNVIASWTNLNTGDDEYAPPPLSDCGLTSTDTGKLVLYGGRMLGNEMRYYDLTRNKWQKPFNTISSGEFVRNGPSLVFYEGDVYMYGGGFFRDTWLYPRQLYSMTPTSNPRSNCTETNSTSENVPVWCMYDESVGKLPYDGVSYHSCALRQHQMICTFGNDAAARRMTIFDLDIMKQHLTIGGESIWMPSDSTSIDWIPPEAALTAYVVVGAIISLYLYRNSKQSDVSESAIAGSIPEDYSLQVAHPTRRLAEEVDNTDDGLEIPEAPVAGNILEDHSPQVAHPTRRLAEEVGDTTNDLEMPEATVVSDDLLIGDSSTQGGSYVGNIPALHEVFLNNSFLLGFFGGVFSFLLLRSDPVPLMVFNVLMNLNLAYAVTHWLYWLIFVKRHQNLGNEEIMECPYFGYGGDRTSNCTRFGWLFVDLAGIGGMSAGLAFSWFEVKEYVDLNKDHSGFFLINFDENLLFSIMSIPISLAAAFALLLVAWNLLYLLVSIIVATFTNGFYMDGDVTKPRSEPPPPKNSREMSESNASGVGPYTTFMTLGWLMAPFMFLYVMTLMGTGFYLGLELLPVFCIPGSIYLWIYSPVATVYRLFDEFIVEKERNRTSDRTISPNTSLLWFFSVALVLATSINLVTTAYLQESLFGLLISDRQSISVIFSQVWLLLVVCAPSVVAGIMIPFHLVRENCSK